MIEGAIVFEAVRCVTLTRGRHRISLAPGAQLRIDPADDSFDGRELRRALVEGRLRRVSPAVFR